MGLSEWVGKVASKGARAKAEAKLARLPKSKEHEGRVEVPMPYANKSAYKGPHSNTEINQAISKAPLKDVPLDQLHAIQHSVSPEIVSRYIDEPDALPKGADKQGRDPRHGGKVDLPIVVRQGGKLYLHDGHHRTTARMLLGEETVTARYVDFDGEKKYGS